VNQPVIVGVPVAGGELRVARWGSGGPVAVAVHGITASHVAWRAVAQNLEGITVLAPDLRGRGGSAHLSAPYGIAAHARDVATVLDHMGVEKAVAVGHSMGAHVVAELAALRPERVTRLVLVDGGLPVPLPPGADPDELLEAVLGPALARLRRTFVSRDEYFSFWRAHPAFAETGCWNAHVEAYLDYDLAGSPPELVSRVSEAAVLADGRDLLVNDSLRDHLGDVACPVLLVRAPRGLLNQSSPQVADRAVDEWRSILPELTDEMVPDTNHYTLLLGEEGSNHIAHRILDATLREESRSVPPEQRFR
jgi:pimeloyl-ACP methyl ester carboxylesterase